MSGGNASSNGGSTVTMRMYEKLGGKVDAFGVTGARSTFQPTALLVIPPTPSALLSLVSLFGQGGLCAEAGTGGSGSPMHAASVHVAPVCCHAGQYVA